MLGFTACTIMPGRSRSLKDACQMGTIPSHKSAFITWCWVCRLHSLKVSRTCGHHLSWIWEAKMATFSLPCFCLTSRARYVLLVTTLPAARDLVFITHVWDMCGSGYEAIKSREHPSLGNKGPYDPTLFLVAPSCVETARRAMLGPECRGDREIDHSMPSTVFVSIWWKRSQPVLPQEPSHVSLVSQDGWTLEFSHSQY